MKMKRLLLSLFALVIIGVFTTRANCTTKACFSRYGIIEDVEEPVTEDVTFSGRTVSESTTVTGTNISVQDVSVINGAKLTLVGNVSIGSTFFVESGSSLEIRQR